MRSTAACPFVLLVATALAAPAHAVTLGFTEDFTANSAGWIATDNATALAHNAIGGVDNGGYASVPSNNTPQSHQLTGNGVILYRANTLASGGEFIGNWVTSGVTKIQAYVRHNYESLPVEFYIRIPSSMGRTGIFFADQLIPASVNDEWSLVNFEITPDNFEVAGADTSTFENVMSAPTAFQIGAHILSSPPVGGVPVEFAIDRISLVPEPSSLALAFGGILYGFAVRRRRVR